MTNPLPDSASSRKAALREAALARRDALEIDERLEWDPLIAEGVLGILATILGPRPEEPAQAGVATGGRDGPALSGASSGTPPTASPGGEGSASWNAGPVSAYWPMRSEADPRPILEVLHGRGVPLCLPAIVERRMLFRRWAPYEPIVPGGFGTLVPDPAQPAVVPAILIVPLAAFDRRGYRIGYGKGHYDAKLTELDGAVSIGIAYAAQEIATVPDEPHDRRLDWIVTEREAFRCG